MGKNKKKKDAFQYFADIFLLGNRALAQTLFWIGLFTVPPVAVGLLILFSILSSAGPAPQGASRPKAPPEYQRPPAPPKYQQPGAAELKYQKGKYRYPPRAEEGAPVYDAEYRDVPPAAPGPGKAPGAKAAKKTVPPPRPAPPQTGRPEADAIIKACDDFVWEAGKTLPEIDDVAVRARAQQTIALVKEIEGWLATQPETAKGAQRLADYYLPTALKLLHTYISVDNNPGPNAQNICKEIDRTLEKFNEALANLQNDLLDTTALDVAAEISAMERMLGSEGLVNDFRIPQPGQARPQPTQPAASGQEEP